MIIMINFFLDILASKRASNDLCMKVRIKMKKKCAFSFNRMAPSYSLSCIGDPRSSEYLPVSDKIS